MVAGDPASWPRRAALPFRQSKRGFKESPLRAADATEAQRRRCQLQNARVPRFAGGAHHSEAAAKEAAIEGSPPHPKARRESGENASKSSPNVSHAEQRSHVLAVVLTIQELQRNDLLSPVLGGRGSRRQPGEGA